MERINRYINTVEEYVVEYFVVLLVGLVFLAAALRYLGTPIVWSVDLAQLLFVWIVFLGGDQALRSNNHIGVDFFIGFLPKKYQRVIYFFHYLLIAVFLIGIGIYGIELTIRNYSRTYNTLGISYSYATAGVPIGCILMLRTVISKLIKGDLVVKDNEVIDIDNNINELNTVK
ncbi:MAG: TRAP transporter small permease [Firmicutes bacterium]|nr:TRAP transporter small permease [Bacillota bacterium]